MPSPPALTIRRVDPQRSRQLIHDSRALMVIDRELIRQSRRTISQQIYLRIVCAWCQQTIRWERVEGGVWGQSSHSICFDCFTPVFGELDPVNAPPPLSKKVHQC